MAPPPENDQLIERMARILGLQQVRIRAMEHIVKLWVCDAMGNKDKGLTGYQAVQDKEARERLDREIAFMKDVLQGKALLTWEEEIAWLEERFQADDTSPPPPSGD